MDECCESECDEALIRSRSSVGKVQKEVIIIGAGISAIGAARTLIQNGVTPVILEASSRIGGRLCPHNLTQNLRTDPAPLSDNDSKVTIQLGANWIHGLEAQVNPMFEVAQKLGLKLHQTSPDDSPGDDVLLFDHCGLSTPSLLNPIPETKAVWEEVVGWASDMLKPFQRILDVLVPIDEPPAAPVAPPNFRQITPLIYSTVLKRYSWITANIGKVFESVSDLPLQEAFGIMIKASEDPNLPFGVCTEVELRCLNWCFDRVAIDSGLTLDSVSSRYYAETASDGEFGEALVQGGFFQIFEHLVNEVKDSLDVRLNSVVQSVSTVTVQNDDGSECEKVEVVCSDGQVFVADSVICTVPVGVLQSNMIQFSPRPVQLENLCKMQMGLMNLVWIWYPYTFWPEGYNFVGVSRDGNTAPTFSTFLMPPMMDQYGNRQAIVMCQTVGKFALEVETKSPAELAQHATALLREIFGNTSVPDAIGCAHSSWFSEPFARGSYSCASFPGAPVNATAPTTTSTDAFPEPVSEEVKMSRVFFAGEATHIMHQGTAHGAYLSGIREASQILFNLGKISENFVDESCHVHAM